jgi:hypothetical protein
VATTAAWQRRTPAAEVAGSRRRRAARTLLSWGVACVAGAAACVAGCQRQSATASSVGVGAPSVGNPEAAGDGATAQRLATASGPTLVDGGAPPNTAQALAELRTWEAQTRAATDFTRVPTSDVALGADPYVVRAVAVPAAAPHGAAYVGILRGQRALVALDAGLHEVSRVPAPASPSGLAVAPSGEIFVAGELSDRVARYRFRNGALRETGAVLLPGVRAMRDIAVGPEGILYVTEEHDGRLLALRPRSEDGAAAPAERHDTVLCHGPIHVMRVARTLLVDCLLDHSVVVRNVDARGLPLPASNGEARIVHDGPMWGFDARGDENGGLLVAVGGVEDHPLDRTEGSFGFVDSFATLYRLPIANGAIAAGPVTPTKLGEVNTSELPVVTPKALALSLGAGGDVRLAVAGYASDRFARITWKGATTRGGSESWPEPEVATTPSVPGNAMILRLPDDSFVAANPLLDSWVHVTGDRASTVHVDDAGPPRSPALRLGEALFFTTLMAPWDKTEGRLSRFTCETCHFEGAVDGRTHKTGRGDIVATTKPLLGLFNNKPHFSRALDPDLTTMVNNEFRVAGAKSDHDPWFSIETRDFPWVAELGVHDETLTPVALRQALMTFFMGFSHRPNASTVRRTAFSPIERDGAAVFRDKCESCHEARLVADDASTRQPFEKWEPLVFSPEDPIVWAHAEYEKTGVIPYVNENGARVVSLRRLYRKYPYFTNGSGKGLENVLDRARFAGGKFFHDGAPQEAAGLTASEKTSLAAFLDLL